MDTPRAGSGSREVIDYGLARRATLEALVRGRTSTGDVCDAHPYLLRAATHHGEPTERPCPVCRRGQLVHVTYVYGDELGQYSGRVKATAEVAAMAAEYGELRVYVVEVCPRCGWNHLHLSYLVGDGARRRPPRRAPTVEDED